VVWVDVYVLELRLGCGHDWSSLIERLNARIFERSANFCRVMVLCLSGVYLFERFEREDLNALTALQTLDG